MSDCIYYHNGQCSNKKCIHYDGGSCRKAGKIKVYHSGPQSLLDQVGIYKQDCRWVLDTEA